MHGRYCFSNISIIYPFSFSQECYFMSFKMNWWNLQVKRFHAHTPIGCETFDDFHLFINFLLL